MSKKIGEQVSVSVDTIGISKKYLLTLCKRQKIQFSADFERFILASIKKFTPSFSGQVYALTLAEDMRGSEISTGGGKTFSLEQFISVIYFFVQRYSQKEGSNGPFPSNYKPYLFRVRIGEKEKGYIVPMLVRLDRRTGMGKRLSVSYTKGMNFDTSPWSGGTIFLFPE